jgi:hypothetical protein
MANQQFWLHVGYGICNNTAMWEELEECLKHVYWQMIPKGGVRGTAPAFLCQMDPGFYGMGCTHPGVECFLAQITKLFVRYGCCSGIGLQMAVLMELLTTALIVSSQPLCKSFLKYGKWVTHSWLQSLWEKVDKFDITVKIAPIPIDPPRAGDRRFMQAVIEDGFTRLGELEIINRFQCHQQVVHVSDILNAGGRCLDKKYLTCRQDDKLWSTLIFPIKKPPQGHLRLWREALLAISSQGRLQNKVGRFLTRGHKIWEWHYNEEEKQVYHHKGQSMDVYTPSLVSCYARRPNC